MFLKNMKILEKRFFLQNTSGNIELAKLIMKSQKCKTKDKDEFSFNMDFEAKKSLSYCLF